MQPQESLQDFILRRLRELDKPQLWLSKEINLDPPALNRWLHGKIKYTNRWISRRAANIATALDCEEQEIRSRSQIGAEEGFPPIELNRDILKALAEQENPTDEMMEVLDKIQSIVGANLTYELCKSLLQLYLTRTNSEPGGELPE